MIQIVEDILVKARDMFQKYGIKSVTMDDLSKEMAISKKTIYSHFCDKSDLVKQVVDMEVSYREKMFNEIFERDINAIEQLIAVNLHINEAMKKVNPAIDYDLKKYYPEIWHDYHMCKREKMYEKLIFNMKKGKDEGLYRANLNEEIIAKLHIFRVECVHDSNVFSLTEFVSTDFTREIFEYHIRGIANENGIKEFEKHKHLITEKN